MLLVARAELRRRPWGFVALAVVVGIGLGATLGAFAAAYRTDHAYPDYLRRANVTDLIVNPSLPSAEFDRAVRALPHVRGAWTEDQLIGGAGDPEKLPHTSGGLAATTD